MMGRNTDDSVLTEAEARELEQQSADWLNQFIQDANRRKAMTPEDIGCHVAGGGDHFFPSVDELIADAGMYTKPQCREELFVCLFEYQLKMDALGADRPAIVHGSPAHAVPLNDAVRGVAHLAFAFTDDAVHLCAYDEDCVRTAADDAWLVDAIHPLFGGMFTNLNNVAHWVRLGRPELKSA